MQRPNGGTSRRLPIMLPRVAQLAEKTLALKGEPRSRLWARGDTIRVAIVPGNLIDMKGDFIVTTWILVSDTSRAKLFSAEKREDDWSLLKDFEHPEGRKQSKEISPSSPPGRMQQSKGLGG